LNYALSRSTPLVADGCCPANLFPHLCRRNTSLIIDVRSLTSADRRDVMRRANDVCEWARMIVAECHADRERRGRMRASRAVVWAEVRGGRPTARAKE